MTQEEDELIPLAKVAERLNVRPVTIRAWIKRGHIQGVKLGRDWFFTEKQIADRYIPKITGRPPKN